MKNTTSISTYHEYILEAISALRVGLHFYEEAKLVSPDIGCENSMHLACINCRYSFLMIANSLEAAANALLISLKLDQDYYEELERLSTLLKYKIFCEINGKRINHRDAKYIRIKDIISCRNEFVHPKPKKVDYDFDPYTYEIQFDIKETKNRKYPLYFNEIRPIHTLTALEDTLAFLGWVSFDICKFNIKEGSFKLGLDEYGSNADIDTIETKYKVSFDKRTFGIED
jgi:hypothetical protein